MKLDVNILRFGHQVAVCVKKRHKNAIFGCSRFYKFNSVCLLLLPMICLKKNCKHIKLCVSFVDRIWGTQIYSTLFWPQSMNYKVRQTNLKKWFLTSLLIYQTFSRYWKLEEKTKFFWKGQMKILICTTYKFDHQKKPKLQPR